VSFLLFCTQKITPLIEVLHYDTILRLQCQRFYGIFAQFLVIFFVTKNIENTPKNHQKWPIFTAIAIKQTILIQAIQHPCN
jgi:hypothetical protein